VEVHDLVRGRDDPIRDRFSHGDAERLGHDIVQGFEVLDVHGRDDVDALVEQAHDVLPAFGVLCTRYIGVRELIDERDFRMSREDRVQVHFFQRDTAIFHTLSWNDLQVTNLRDGIGPMMSFNKTNHYVDAPAPQVAGFVEHPICLPHAGRGADVQLEPPALTLPDEGEEVAHSPGKVTT